MGILDTCAVPFFIFSAICKKASFALGLSKHLIGDAFVIPVFDVAPDGVVILDVTDVIEVVFCSNHSGGTSNFTSAFFAFMNFGFSFFSG
jgi:hypothetical protein